VVVSRSSIHFNEVSKVNFLKKTRIFAISVMIGRKKNLTEKKRNGLGGREIISDTL
jgi:hypothetical protein